MLEQLQVDVDFLVARLLCGENLVVKFIVVLRNEIAVVLIAGFFDSSRRLLWLLNHQLADSLVDFRLHVVHVAASQLFYSILKLLDRLLDFCFSVEIRFRCSFALSVAEVLIVIKTVGRVR